MWGDPDELYYRWSGSVGHYCHQQADYLNNCSWREFCYWINVAKAWEDANAIEL